MKTNLTLFTLASLGLVTTVSASITSGIINGDFSNDGLTSGFQPGIVDWGQTSGTFLEARDADMGSTSGNDPAGGLEATGAYIFQEFGVHDTANELFEVSMFTGMTNSRPGTADLDIQLWSGVAGQSGSLIAGTQLGANVNVADLTVAGGAVIGGGTLTVEIGTTGAVASGGALYLVVLANDMFTDGGNTAQLFVDDISLTSIPEASSFALLAGLGGLASVMLRRRR